MGTRGSVCERLGNLDNRWAFIEWVVPEVKAVSLVVLPNAMKLWIFLFTGRVTDMWHVVPGGVGDKWAWKPFKLMCRADLVFMSPTEMCTKWSLYSVLWTFAGEMGKTRGDGIVKITPTNILSSEHGTTVDPSYMTTPSARLKWSHKRDRFLSKWYLC